MSTAILKNINDDNEWNYNDVPTYEELSEKIESKIARNVYWDLKGIIENFISTKHEDAFDTEEDKKYAVEDYYKVLTKKYKKKQTKQEFEKIANDFIDKFIIEDHLGYKYVDSFIIEKVYLYEQNKYLCYIRSNELKSSGYIGIELDDSEHKYAIFYIE